MNQLISFLSVLAWIFCPLSLIIIALKCYLEHEYNHPKKGSRAAIQKALDGLNNIKRTWPLGIWPYVFIFTLSFLISKLFH